MATPERRRICRFIGASDGDARAVRDEQEEREPDEVGEDARAAVRDERERDARQRHDTERRRRR